MRELPKPTENVATHFRLCANATREVALRLRLLGYEPRVVAAADAYENAGVGATFFAIRPVVAASDADQELADLYARTMARRGAVARSLYNALKHSAPNSMCPFCGHRVVTTIDHYLPKEAFPDLSVVPSNLVPACSDCNKRKGAHFPAVSDDQLFHPYYDRIPSGKWLSAALDYFDHTPVIRLECNPPAAWPVTLRTRMVRHFSHLDLGNLYSIYGGQEISMIRGRLEMLLVRSGEEAVRVHLEEEFFSRAAVDPNSWQAATYGVLCSEPRFYRGEFGV